MLPCLKGNSRQVSACLTITQPVKDSKDRHCFVAGRNGQDMVQNYVAQTLLSQNFIMSVMHQTHSIRHISYVFLVDWSMSSCHACIVISVQISKGNSKSTCRIEYFGGLFGFKIFLIVVILSST